MGMPMPENKACENKGISPEMGLAAKFGCFCHVTMQQGGRHLIAMQILLM
jgi:hypothetical protein